jgi:hypothetical protein
VREIADAARRLAAEKGRSERTFTSLNQRFFLVFMRALQKVGRDRLKRDVVEFPDSVETDFG